MLVQIKPSVTISKVVQLFKGGSSKIIRSEFPELEEFLWGDSFWGDGYFAETVGKLDREIVKNTFKINRASISINTLPGLKAGESITLSLSLSL